MPTIYSQAKKGGKQIKDERKINAEAYFTILLGLERL
jgi:hypothetical protein